MPSIPALLVVCSGLIVLVFAVLHLIYTYSGRKFQPRDADLFSRMQEVSPYISRETTMWNSGLGFHASHSIGVMLFALVYIDLAVASPQLLFHSPVLLGIGLVYLLALVAIAWRHWFSLPRRGIIVSALLYLLAVALAVVNGR
ncbi:MAG: hypothetical protein ABI639_02435 [Thermoanaerobaculia bacterium]